MVEHMVRRRSVGCHGTYASGRAPPIGLLKTGVMEIPSHSQHDPPTEGEHLEHRKILFAGIIEAADIRTDRILFMSSLLLPEVSDRAAR
jgi:hypothetical protein